MMLAGQLFGVTKFLTHVNAPSIISTMVNRKPVIVLTGASRFLIYTFKSLGTDFLATGESVWLLRTFC